MRLDVFLVFLFGYFSVIKGQTISFGCPRGWQYFNNKCYKFSSEKKFYEQADAECFSQGAELASIETYNEHQFISDWLVANDILHELRWYTSGFYFMGEMWWGDNVRDTSTNNFWVNQQRPLDRSAVVYRVVYIYSGTGGYRLTNVSASFTGGSICEVERTKAQNFDILNRDYDYGLGEEDATEVKRGPIVTEDPVDVVFFEGAFNVELECTSFGIPFPTYSWYRGDIIDSGKQSLVTSKDSKRYTLSAGKFTIDRPEENTDQNYYHCSVSNSVGTALSNQAQVFFGYLGTFPNYKPKDLYAAAFKGTKMECEAPSYSPRVTYQWFKNAASNIFVYAGNANMFVSWSGSLYVSEVQPTDSPKNYFCVVTLIGTDTARLAKANTISRTNLGILLLLSSDSSTNNDYGPILFTHVFPAKTVVGTNIRMECIAYGTHPLSYTWYRQDGRPFSPGTVLSDRNRVLTIKNAPLEADGNYVCKCSRKTGSTATKVITLLMESKPYFPYPIGNKFLDVGMSFEWYCKAVARPTATYSWFKNGERIQNIPGEIEVRGNILWFGSVVKERHDGMYQCAATNQHGTTFSTGELRVLSFAPNFNRYPLPSMTLAPNNGNITIPCSVEGAPKAEVQWLKNGGNLGLSVGDVNSRIGMDAFYGLVMTQINSGDSGSYTCQATNALGTASNTTYVRVIEGVAWQTRPQFTYEVMVNSSVSMLCVARANVNYDLMYTWTFNGREIDFMLHPNFVQSSEGHQLTVTHAQFQNQGRYECEARTTINSIKADTYLKVKGPPSMPAGVYVDEDTITARSARVVWTWEESMERGGSVFSFDVEAESHFHPGVWQVVARDIEDSRAAYEANQNGKRANQRAYTVTNLIPNTNYRFRVRATNMFGKGKDASKPSTSKKIDATAPVIPPRNVGGGGGKVGTLTISWDILDPSEHCGDNLEYLIYWKKIGDNRDYRKEIGNTSLALRDGKFVTEVGKENFYLKYEVKVAARNHKGTGPNSTEVVIFSAEEMPNAVVTARDSVTFNGTSIIVYWEPIGDNRTAIGGRVRGYRVQYYPDYTGDTPTDYEPDSVKNEIRSKDVYGQTDHMQLIGLYQNTEYLTRVMVFNGAGIGPKGEWRRSETANDLLKEYPTHVYVYSNGEHSVRVKWRGVGVNMYEASLEGYIIRVWKLQDDVRSATDYRIDDKVNEYVITNLQTTTVYVLRVLGYSVAGDGAISEAVYFAIQEQGQYSLALNIDPTTSEICVDRNGERTCGGTHISGWPLLVALLSTSLVYFFTWR